MMFSALSLLCSYVCSMFHWLIGNAMLIYHVIVNLKLHVPWFDVCWSLDYHALFIYVRTSYAVTQIQ